MNQSKDATLHQRILSDIEGRIVSGEWPPGHRIPFEIDLTKEYDCSRMTVNKALTQLAKAGLKEVRQFRHAAAGTIGRA
jgi:GntR family histidine utilization transcriptional repressor